MIDYKTYEKEVFDWLMQKHKADPDFTFSVRRNGSKGAELDYFVGTKKSSYFATTFWTIPVGFPGSSGDAISLIFISTDTDYQYNFEFHQTNSPSSDQNRSALNLLKSIKSTAITDLGFSYESAENNKMFSLKTNQRKATYSSLGDMFEDIEIDLTIIVPAINEAITLEKTKNSSFIAHRITQDEFNKWQKKLENRFKKYDYKNFDKGQSKPVRESFSLWLTKIESSKKAQSYLRAIDILNEILDTDIYAERNIAELTLLYQDLLEKQKEVDGKYYYENAPSYGVNRFYSASVNAFIKFINEGQGITITKEKRMITDNFPVNQILYGPPGTGKTFNTVNRALEICGESVEGLDRKEIKELYDLKVSEGQIIFTTFHQSMAYEDFIEGIKPLEPEKEGDPVIYKVIEGIFKKACIEASFNFAMDNNDTDTDKVLDFSLAYDNFIQKLEERLASESSVELEIKNGGKVYVDSISAQGNIQIKHLDGLRTYTVSKTRLSKLQKAITNLDEISNINDSFRAIIGGSNSTAYWSVLNAIQKENHFDNNFNNIERKYSLQDKIEVVKELDKNIYKGNSGKPIVLIIDEINRGNVSAIFGELITLIEKDKRLGADEALIAQLPYSKEIFGVPPNLYIIGTMNTADRSVEALDSALRRRFSFTEMPPNPKLIKEVGSNNDGFIEDINLVKLLETINKRIEKLIDRDHAIGHSYFLKLKYLKELKAVFANKVIPLLQEYFFGDYGRIGLVLGSGFVASIQGDNDDSFFAAFEDYDLGTLLERKVYRIKDTINMSNYDFKKALFQLLG